jgi:DNA-directed RNA polymerase subunit M/transcription elongation factor TFIIS
MAAAGECCLEAWPGVPPHVRVVSLRALHGLRPQRPADEAAALEAAVHTQASASVDMYCDAMLRLLHNLRGNPALQDLGTCAVALSDHEMASGTAVAAVDIDEQTRYERFERMVQDKYDEINDHTSTLKCRRCGSAEVAWEQKQTRGCDEAMTIFCTCMKCKNRWKMS